MSKMIVLLLLFSLIASVAAFESSAYYLSTTYYDDSEITMNWTANRKTMRERVNYIENLVEVYKSRQLSPKDKMNELSFDELPFDEYEVMPHGIHRVSAFESRTVYRITFYIAHEQRRMGAWYDLDVILNWARLSCVVTDSDTYCSVAYNDPISQVTLTISAIIAGVIMFISLIITCICCHRKRRWRADLEINTESTIKRDSPYDKMPIINCMYD